MEDTCDELSATIFVNCRLVKVSLFRLSPAIFQLCMVPFRSEPFYYFIGSSYFLLFALRVCVLRM